MCDSEDINIMKDKLISFPKIILDKLDEYKDKTGISSTDYIRTALIRQMVIDKLIFFQTRYISTTKKEENINVNSLPEELKFCDSDHCDL